MSLALIETLAPGEVTDDEFLAQAEGRIRGYGKLVVSGIVEIGRELVGVKQRLPGRYNAFVHAMLRLNNLLSQADDLTIDASSLYLIAAPSTPAQAREAVLEQAATPEGISREEVERLIAEAREEADRAARSEFDDKLIITEDELAERIDAVDTKYAKKLAKLEKANAKLIEQRNSARANTRAAQARPAIKSKPIATAVPTFDSTTSFRAMCIGQSLAALKAELRITPRQLIDIERELAAKVHHNPELATTKLAEINANARATHAWLGDLIEALTE